MAWYFLVPLLIFVDLFVGSAAFAYAHRKVVATCHHNEHHDCFHTAVTVVTCYLAPVAVPLWIVGLTAVGVANAGAHIGRSPSQRRDIRESTENAVKQFREDQRRAAEEELELQLYGVQRCKHCNSKIRKRRGVWVDVSDSSNGCEKNPGHYGGPHEVPDALEAKIDKLAKEREEADAEDGDYIVPTPIEKPKFDKSSKGFG